MADPIHIATGTGDIQAFSGSGTVYGYSIRESAGTPAVATVILRHGTLATDPAVALIELAANQSLTEKLPALSLPNGLFVDRVAGETELVIYTS